MNIEAPTERIEHMLASTTPELMADVTSLPWEPFNAALRVASGYADFASAVIRDNAHAAREGLRIVDAYVNPDGREGDGSAKVKTFPTDLDGREIGSALDRIRVLARLAARTDDDGREKLNAPMRASMARLGSMDARLWDAWVASEKAHMSGPDAAVLEVEGFAWTASRKGHVTEIRYREDAQSYTRNGKAMHASGIAEGMLSETDLAEIMEEIG